MLQSPLLLPPSAGFWSHVAKALLDGGPLAQFGDLHDCSTVRMVVPALSNAQQLRTALADWVGRAFIPPRITTLQAWLATVPPEFPVPGRGGQRLMSLYAELRQHAWLKTLFTTRRNTDLLPLAQTLLALFDELRQALLPTIRLSPDAAEERWQAALDQLSTPARDILSEEAQL